jgi:DNA-binding NarL/FixJ family response regulator
MSTSAPGPIRGKVLIIDDSWVMLDGIRTALAADGYQVKVASELEVAKRHIANVDLCIVDFHMPGIDGAEVLRALKQELKSAGDCAFYLYTSDPDVARDFAKLGFDGFFVKKGEAQVIASQVDAVFRTIRMRKLAADLKRKRNAS